MEEHSSKPKKEYRDQDQSFKCARDDDQSVTELTVVTAYNNYIKTQGLPPRFHYLASEERLDIQRSEIEIEGLDLEIKARDEIIGKLVNKNRSLTLAYDDLRDKYESKEADLSIQLQNIRARVAETTKHLRQASGQSRATREVVSAVLEGQRRLSQPSNRPTKWNTRCQCCSEIFGFAEAIFNAALSSSRVLDKLAPLEGLLAKQKACKDSTSQPPLPSVCDSTEVRSVLGELFAIFEPVLESPPVREVEELEKRLKDTETEVARLTELTRRLQKDLQESQLCRSRTSVHSVSSFAPSSGIEVPYMNAYDSIKDREFNHRRLRTVSDARKAANPHLSSAAVASWLDLATTTPTVSDSSFLTSASTASDSHRPKGESRDQTLASESEALIAAKELELAELRRKDIKWACKVVPLLEKSAEIAAMRKSAAATSSAKCVEAEAFEPPTTSTEEDVSQGSSATYTKADGQQSLDISELEARITEVRTDLSSFVQIFSQDELRRQDSDRLQVLAEQLADALDDASVLLRSPGVSCRNLPNELGYAEEVESSDRVDSAEINPEESRVTPAAIQQQLSLIRQLQADLKLAFQSLPAYARDAVQETSSYNFAHLSPKRRTRDKLVDCCHGFLEEDGATALEEHQDETMAHLRDQVASLQDQLARRTSEIEEARNLIVKLYEETADTYGGLYPPLSALNRNARLCLLIQMFFGSQNNKISELESRIHESEGEGAKLQACISRLCEQLEEGVEAGKVLSETRKELVSRIINLTQENAAEEEDELVAMDHALFNKPQSPLVAHESFPGCDNKRFAHLLNGVTDIKWQASLSPKITEVVIARLTNWAKDLAAKSAFSQATEKELNTTQANLAKLAEQLVETNANLNASKQEIVELQTKLHDAEQKLRLYADAPNEVVSDLFRLPPPPITETDWKVSTPNVSIVDAWTQSQPGDMGNKTALCHTDDVSSGTEPDENTRLLESFDDFTSTLRLPETRPDVVKSGDSEEFEPYTTAFVSTTTQSVPKMTNVDPFGRSTIEPDLAETSAQELGGFASSQEIDDTLNPSVTSAELESCISSLRAQLEKADVEHQVGVELLRGKLSAALDRLRGLQVVQSAYQTDLQRLKMVLALKTKQEEELNRTITSMTKRMTELVCQVDSLKDECLLKESEKTDVLIELEGLRGQLTDATDEMAGLRNALAEYESLQKNMSFVLTQKDAMLAEAKLTESRLQRKLELGKSELANLQASYDELGRVSELLLRNTIFVGETIDWHVNTQPGTESQPSGLSESTRSAIQRWKSSSALDSFAELVLVKEGLQCSDQLQNTMTELQASMEAYRRVATEQKAKVLSEVSDSKDGQAAVTVDSEEPLPWNPCCVSAVSYIAAVAHEEPLHFNLLRELAYSEACRVRLAGALAAAEQQVGELKALLESLQMEVEMNHAEIAARNRQLILQDANDAALATTDEVPGLHPSSQKPGGDTHNSVTLGFVEMPVETKGEKRHSPDSLMLVTAASRPENYRRAIDRLRGLIDRLQEAFKSREKVFSLLVHSWTPAEQETEILVSTLDAQLDEIATSLQNIEAELVASPVCGSRRPPSLSSASGRSSGKSARLADALVKLERQKRYMLRLFEKIYERLLSLESSENRAIGDDFIAAEQQPLTDTSSHSTQRASDGALSWEEHARKLEATISAKSALIDNLSSMLRELQLKINGLEQRCTDSEFAKQTMTEKLEEAEKNLRRIVSGELVPAKSGKISEEAVEEAIAMSHKNQRQDKLENKEEEKNIGTFIREIADIINGGDREEENQMGDFSENGIKERLREIKERSESEKAEKGRLLGALAKLREKTQKLEEEINEKSKAQSEMEDRESKTEMERENLKKMLSGVREELEESRAAVEAASKRLEEVEGERSALQGQLEDSMAMMADAERRRSALEEGRRDSEEAVEQLRGDNERLSKELEGLRAQLSTLEAQLGEASSELESKSAELSAASGKASASEMLETENTNLKVMLSGLREELEESRAAVEAASKRLQEVEEEKAVLGDELASIRSSPAVVATEAVTLAAEPMISPVEVMTVQAASSAPEAPAEGSLADLASVMPAVMELNLSLGLEVETKAEEAPTALLLKENLMSACVRVQEMQHAWKDEATRSAEVVSALRLELEALKSDLCAANARCQALERTAEGRSAMLKDQALSSDGYEEELADRLKERCRRLLESLATDGVDVDGDAEDPIGLLDDALRRVCEDRRRLVAKVATSEQEEGELRRTIELLRVEVEATRGKLDDALAMKDELEATCKLDGSQLEELSGTLEVLLSSLSSKVKELEKMVREDGCVDKERVVAKMEELKQEKMNLDGVVENLSGENERLSEEVEGLRAQLSTLEAQLGEASSELESKSAELSAASGKASASEVLETENANLKAMLSGLREELEESRAAVEAASKRLEEVQEEKAVLGDELASIRSAPVVVATEAMTLAAEPIISPVEGMTVQAASNVFGSGCVQRADDLVGGLTVDPYNQPDDVKPLASPSIFAGYIHRGTGSHCVSLHDSATMTVSFSGHPSTAGIPSDSDSCVCYFDSSVSSFHADFCPLSLPLFYRSLLSKLLLFVSFADGCLRQLNIPVDLHSFPLFTSSFDACSKKLASLLRDVEFAFQSAVLAASAESLSLNTISSPCDVDWKFPNFTELLDTEPNSSSLLFDHQALLCLSSCLYFQLRRVLLRGFGFDLIKESPTREGHQESEKPEADAPSVGARRLSESWLSFAALLKALHLPNANYASEEIAVKHDSPLPLSQCLCSLHPRSVQSHILSRLPGRGHLPEAVGAFSSVQALDAASQTPTEMLDFLIGNRGDSLSPAPKPQLDPSAFIARPSQGRLATSDGFEGLSPDGEGLMPLSLGVVSPLASMQLSCQSAPCLVWSEDRRDPLSIETLRLQALSSLDAFALKFSKYSDVQSSPYGDQFFPLSALSDQIANLRAWLIDSEGRSGFKNSDRSKAGRKEGADDEEDMTPRTSQGSAKFTCETQTCPEQQPELGICEGGESPVSEESANTPAFAQPTNEIFLRRLLNVRDTEVLYLLTHMPEAQALAESGSLNSLPSAEYMEAQMKMFAHWDLVSPVDAKCLPIHRVKIMSTAPDRTKHTRSPAGMDSDKIPSSILDDVMKRFQTSHLSPLKHRDYVWLDSDLEAVVKSLLRRCHALLKLVATPLKGHRGSRCRNQLSKTHVKEFHDLSLQLAQIVGCKPITTNTATSVEPLSNGTYTATEDLTSTEPIRFCLMPEPQGYTQNRPNLPILELVTTINQATSLPGLRSLAEFLIDQYHILQTELEQQLDTNWQLRRRLHVANNKVAEIAQEICANNQRLEVAGRRLHVEAEKGTLVHATADGPPPTVSRDRLLTTPVRSHRMTRRSEISRLQDQLSTSRQLAPSEDSTHQSKPVVAETLERPGEPTPMHFDSEQNAELSGSSRFSETQMEDSPGLTEGNGEGSRASYEKEAVSKIEFTNGASFSPPSVQLVAPSQFSAPSPSPTPVGEASSSRQQPKKQKSLLRKVAAVFKPSMEGTE
ncbi:unnamed protein product [Schistocephalus solidus]|uniref:Uncharacterized protein n=1 Tax=Schistocephalus solidus TaxID=70667 RepID=A0A183SX90_SCHSO|nr:unnamed protein product [Schistocephalus solidus]